MITLPHTVTIRRPGVDVDRYSNTIPDWDDVTDVEDVPAWVQQRTTTVEVQQRTTTVEAGPGRAAVVSTWMVFLPAGTVIADGDQVIWDSRAFTVDGEPHHLHNPAGEHHLQVQLETVDG